MTCKGCERRRIGCHASCEDYKAFKERMKAGSEERQANRIIYEYVMDRVIKTRKRNRRH